MKCARAGLVLLSLALVPPASAGEDRPAADIAYRADQPQFRLPDVTDSAQLPKRLEDYIPPPPPPAPPKPVDAEKQPETKTPTPVVYAWDRVRAGYTLPDLDGALVARWQDWYVQRPQLLRAMFERSRPYIYHVVEEIDKRGLPTELAFLPMVESGYDPNALSPARASGLWQFIPSTGKAYRLEQGLLRDARRDIVASTAAGLDYLQALHQRFGDWQLALAAYNCGEGCVARALARAKARGASTRYAALALPEETRNYLPKLQALKNIVAHPGAFNIRIEPVPNAPYFTVIKSERYIDVDIAARLADMKLDDFLALNPSFNLNLISKGPRRHILLPLDKAEVFLTNLDNYREPPARMRKGLRKNTSKARSAGSAAGID